MKRICPKCGSLNQDHIRNGYFKRRRDGKTVQRFRCKICKKEFSDATFQARYRQRLRHLNGVIEKEFISGSSIRRMAKTLGINPKTVSHRLEYLAKRARASQARRLKKLKNIQEVQFDDMESFEHTKLKPVSITIAVVKKKRIILGAEVSQMPAKGLIAKRSRKKYGRRKDHRKKARDSLFEKIKPSVSEFAQFESDQQPHYPESVQHHFPGAIHKTFKGRRACVTGQGELKAGGFDPLFSLNHTCAMLRYAISRLVRRTWVTTKKIQQLQNHIDIYIDYHNRLLV